MDKSMYFSLAAMLVGLIGIATAVFFKDVRMFMGGMALAVVIFTISPQKKKKQQQS